VYQCLFLGKSIFWGRTLGAMSIRMSVEPAEVKDRPDSRIKVLSILCSVLAILFTGLVLYHWRSRSVKRENEINFDDFS